MRQITKYIRVIYANGYDNSHSQSGQGLAGSGHTHCPYGFEIDPRIWERNPVKVPVHRTPPNGGYWPCHAPACRDVRLLDILPRHISLKLRKTPAIDFCSNLSRNPEREP
jgi:hypothetical protein